MQNASDLTYERIPCRFCENGEPQQQDSGGQLTGDFVYPVASSEDQKDVTYVSGFSAAFSTLPADLQQLSKGAFIRRQHVNGIGRLGTSAQALVQAGGTFGYVEDVTYGRFAAIEFFDGSFVKCLVSDSDSNNVAPPLAAGMFYSIMESDEVVDGIPEGVSTWHLASFSYGSSIFDVS